MVSFYEEDTFEALATTGAKALKWPKCSSEKLKSQPVTGGRNKG